ncbi:hypothetical protein D3C78_1123440 [compost metagenome]
MCQRGVVQRQNLCRQQGSIGGTGFADGQRTHWNTARHLHDRIQAVYTAQCGALHRNTQHRNQRFRRQHARQMRSTACTGNDHVKAIISCLLGKAEQLVWRAMSGNDFDMERDIKRGQDFGGKLHGGPVTFRSHYNCDFNPSVGG